MYVAAVFSNGHVATGRHHGEAFSKLSEEDQEADLISGFINSKGNFITELEHTNKEIIIIRHAESMSNIKKSESFDSFLSLKGINQAQKVAKYIRKNIDCRGFIGFTSPFDRCLLTSLPIRRHTGIKFFVNKNISELSDAFPECGVRVPRRNYLEVEWGNYFSTLFKQESPINFIERLFLFLNNLPDKSIVVTHGSVVQILIEMVLGVKVSKIPEWDNSIGNCSITHIKDGEVICLAKNLI